MKFTDTSEIHEIPPKPKRRQDKRSRSAPSPFSAKLRRKNVDGPTTLADKSPNNVVDVTDGGGDVAAVVVVEQFQRASVTSVVDIIENRTYRDRR